MALPTRTEIIDSLQFPFLSSYVPMNETGEPRYTLSYQFAGSTQPPDNLWTYTGWKSWTLDEKNTVRAALANIETFLNIDFAEVTGDSNPNINFGLVTLDPAIAGEGGCAYPVSRWDASVMFNKAYTLLDSYGNHVVSHEIGHALGLDHPFDGVTLNPAFDNNHYTIMSYDFDPIAGGYLEFMGLYDILALQSIWGAASYRTGDTTYTGRGSFDVRVVWDTGGTDLFDASDRSNAVTLDLREGRFSTFGAYEDVAVAFGAVIENATGGSAGDLVRGNAAANVLRGLGGNDKLVGYQGADTLLGGTGNDRLYGGGGNDIEKGLAGADLIRGGAGADVIRGGGGKDTLNGGSGRDVIFGGSGADQFVFTKGNDRDILRDFQDNIDTIKVVGHGSYNAVFADAAQSGSDVIFDFGGGDYLVIRNVTIGALHDDLIVA